MRRSRASRPSCRNAAVDASAPSACSQRLWTRRRAPAAAALAAARASGTALRYEAGREGEGEERSGPEGPWHGDYTGSIWPRRTPTIVETPGSCIVTPYTASAACMVRGL